ncbi:CubicO group peptidase (beta-lactamase class C family) [Lipingzhangella halophila]|uniref:CubicO group peptidase (Beta-lactamase class C family) n=1 Tax=Lipingzhangella halophila TaxID=1783352 RepID=A0A7W7W0D2_9ACTN|nr:serine hydrolase domain-containing protein [Lipingzhangella halophila]MBB4929506.1 CubicO group peptidase (beta-lactamase class C family) [Lipingzhangella halophila]
MITRDRTRQSPHPRHGGRHRPLAALAVAGALAVLATGCGGAEFEPTFESPASTPEDTADLTEKDVNAWLDENMPAALEEAGIIGGAVSVVHDGEILTARGYGHSDVAKEEPVDPDETLFRPGSVSKTVTATAVMHMVEAGEIDLDTDVNEYLDFELEKSFDEDVTVRHLLSHTAGFEEKVAGMFQAPGTEVDLREVVSEDPPEQVYEPGTTPAYSNYGYDLVGYIVENVSGMSFEEYAEQNVLEPAGMDSSSFEQPLPKELESRLSEGYAAEGEPPEDFENIADIPAGALTASATDMGRFMLAQMGDTQGPSPVLAPETLSTMHEPALGSESLGGLADGHRMTPGFFEEHRNGNRIYGHGGDTNWFHSHMQIFPDQETGIFFTMNSSGNPGSANVTLRTALMEEFADRYFPGAESGEGEVESTASEHAAMLEGTYANSRSIHSNFLSALYLVNEHQITAQEDGTILLEPSPTTGKPAVFEEVEPWVWREVDGGSTMAARVVDGEVEAIGTTASTLMPADPVTQSSVSLPIMGASLVVLLLTIVSWPIGAIVRKVRSLPKRDPAARRWARVLTRAAVTATVLAYAAWVSVGMLAMGGQDTPFAVLEVIQGIQTLGLFGVIPAGVVLYDNIRRGAGWKRYVGSALVLLALLGSGWFAANFAMVAGSVSY